MDGATQSLVIADKDSDLRTSLIQEHSARLFPHALLKNLRIYHSVPVCVWVNLGHEE